MSTGRGRDIAVSGQLTIERATGRVTGALLQFSEKKEQVEGAFDVTYRTSEGLDVLIPDRLWEWYLTVDPDHAGRQAYVEGQASYMNIRRFTVSTEETLKSRRVPFKGGSSSLHFDPWTSSHSPPLGSYSCVSFDTLMRK